MSSLAPLPSFPPIEGDPVDTFLFEGTYTTAFSGIQCPGQGTTAIIESLGRPPRVRRRLLSKGAQIPGEDASQCTLKILSQ